MDSCWTTIIGDCSMNCLSGADKIALATVSGHFTASYLALANRQELERRVVVMNSLSAQEFEAQLSSGRKTTDPEV